MEYQILALDLDGTLTNSQKEISATNTGSSDRYSGAGQESRACQRTSHQGSSSTCEDYIWKTTEAIFSLLTVPRITDCRSMQAIYNKTLPGDIVEPLLQILRKYDGLDILSYTADNILSGIKPNKYTATWNPGSITCRSSETDDFATSH